MSGISYRTADVDGLTVFYREAGAPGAPTLVLLHGFPSARSGRPPPRQSPSAPTSLKWGFSVSAVCPGLRDDHVVAPGLPAQVWL